MSVQVDVNALFMDLVGSRMVACGETKQVVPSGNKWTVECWLYHPGNKEDAKAGITQFLQQAWRASEIRFFQKHGARPGQFWVSFSSDDF